MLSALSFALVDSVNLLLIGVIVAVGIVAPTAGSRYGRITSLLVAGDWLGVAGLALLMLAIFDGLGPIVRSFVDGPVFGIVLIATGLVTAILALRGGDNQELVERIMAPLRRPGFTTFVTGAVLGVVQSATSVPFYGGLALLSAAGVSPATRYATLPLYATVALSLPIVCALAVAVVRRHPESAVGRAFSWARENSQCVTLGATWAVAAMLVLLGGIHFV